ncbi:hypothetical protein GCM10010441_20430 [Kitasatospora paracochleata]
MEWDGRGPFVLRELVGSLETILAGPGTDYAADLLARTAELGGSGQIAEVIEAVSADRELLGRCASRSFAHPLGFQKFVLLAGRRFEVRLHLWVPGAQVATEHVHNHRFAFASYVLLGRLSSNLYDHAADGVLAAGYRESRSADARTYLFSPTGLVRVVRRETTELSTGMSYFMNPETLHQVSPVDTPSASLVIKIPTPRTTTTVLMPPLQKPPRFAARTALTLDTARSMLRDALELIRR